MATHVWRPSRPGWGRSNAGLVTGRGAALLVDTLLDVATTRRMLADFGPAVRHAPIGTVVNTHGDPDHWFGNQLLAGAEIIATEPAALEMRATDPADVARAPMFAGFDFAEVEPTYPTRTFRDRLSLDIGGIEVELIEVGPAHTVGDLIVHVPSASTVFAGDLVFVDCTPIVWAGPVRRCIDVCRQLLDLGADRVVPGHGPTSTMAGVRDTVDYLEFVHEHASQRRSAGMDVTAAARDIDLGRFRRLAEPERLLANVHAVYRDLGDDVAPLSKPELIERMAKEPLCPNHDPA
jgi:glyoxylase-like metal-dependent hydrolase (beta-lactamase superfamily II)